MNSMEIEINLNMHLTGQSDANCKFILKTLYFHAQYMLPHAQAEAYVCLRPAVGLGMGGETGERRRGREREREREREGGDE